MHLTEQLYSFCQSSQWKEVHLWDSCHLITNGQSKANLEKKYFLSQVCCLKKLLVWPYNHKRSRKKGTKIQTWFVWPSSAKKPQLSSYILLLWLPDLNFKLVSYPGFERAPKHGVWERGEFQLQRHFRTVHQRLKRDMQTPGKGHSHTHFLQFSCCLQIQHMDKKYDSSSLQAK